MEWPPDDLIVADCLSWGGRASSANQTRACSRAVDDNGFFMKGWPPHGKDPTS